METGNSTKPLIASTQALSSPTEADNGQPGGVGTPEVEIVPPLSYPYLSIIMAVDLSAIIDRAAGSQINIIATETVGPVTRDTAQPGLELVDALAPNVPDSSLSGSMPLSGEPVTRVMTYIYDPLNRMTRADYNNGVYFHYTYDAVGNRLTEETLGGTINTSTYDAANRLSAVDGVTYTWDNNGNLLSDGVRSYTYNHANRLSTITGPSYTASMVYNGQGDRMRQTVNGVATTYTLDMAGGLTQVLSDGTHTYLYGSGRIAQYSGTAPEYFLPDALGSVRQLADASGNVTLAQSFQPFGETLSQGGCRAEPIWLRGGMDGRLH